MFKQWEQAPRGKQLPLDDVLSALKINDDGLIPAIAQQHDTGEVLMMAWMNRVSIEETLATGQVCYWSRSRQTYWRKGESSGHRQQLVNMKLDCDGDVLLLAVDQQGPACHTNRHNCFFFELTSDGVTVTSDPDSGLHES
jgi:phosphoribosyl-AMP cyclohydrolase